MTRPSPRPKTSIATALEAVEVVSVIRDSSQAPTVITAVPAIGKIL